MQPSQLGLGRRGAQLCFLHTAAGRAHEVVMMSGATTDVGTRGSGEEGPHGAGPSQELERAIRRREPKPRVERTSARVQLGHGEASLPLLDEAKDHSPLFRRTDTAWQGQRHGINLPDTDSHSQSG